MKAQAHARGVGWSWTSLLTLCTPSAQKALEDGFSLVTPSESRWVLFDTFLGCGPEQGSSLGHRSLQGHCTGAWITGKRPVCWQRSVPARRGQVLCQGTRVKRHPLATSLPRDAITCVEQMLRSCTSDWRAVAQKSPGIKDRKETWREQSSEIKHLALLMVSAKARCGEGSKQGRNIMLVYCSYFYTWQATLWSKFKVGSKWMKKQCQLTDIYIIQGGRCLFSLVLVIYYYVTNHTKSLNLQGLFCNFSESYELIEVRDLHLYLVDWLIDFWFQCECPGSQQPDSGQGWNTSDCFTEWSWWG